jgi:hypothetical protein
MWMVTSYYSGSSGMCFSLLLLMPALLVPVTTYRSWAAQVVRVQLELAMMVNINTWIVRSRLLSTGRTPVSGPTLNLANWGS